MTWVNSLKAIGWIAFMATLLFSSAGTVDWPGAWVFMAEMVLGSLFTVLWLKRHDPGLLKERMGGLYQKGQVFWDKVFMTLVAIIWYGWLVLMGLDAKRWAASHVPLAVVLLGAVLIPIGFAGVLWTFRENSFAAPVIKIQGERGHRVIDTGPYAIVRHPMYAGAFLYMLGTPLVLGSWIGLVVLPLIVGFLIVRIFIEERTLKSGLPGYEGYMARVRWRLVPGLW
jgi:protein-S-isoprenylcysteine O-methyltransferase Ste14